jgi:Mg/Co/Ni transporter MgtE
MAVSEWRMNRFERILFRAALILAGLIVAVRLGAVVAIWYFHHYR